MMGEGGERHKVTLTQDFYIGVFEVTQGQWEKVMKANPSSFKAVGEGAPVDQVSWDDCQGFCKELNGKSKTLGFRLADRGGVGVRMPRRHRGRAIWREAGRLCLVRPEQRKDDA